MTSPWGWHGRAALAGALVAGALVTGFSTGEAAGVAPAADPPPAYAESVRFDTPGEHAWTVPPGVTRVDVVAVGGYGGVSAQRSGGRGARIFSTLDVTPGQVLYAVVGSNASGTTPGFNGGGAAGGTAAECPVLPGAGGGASDVRTVPLGEPGSAESRVLVAGGGGGAASADTAVEPDDYSTLQLYGGHRGQGGGTPDLGGWGGAAGNGGHGGARGDTDGTGTTGGRGMAGVAGTASGCGGGGGGGYGGGGGGAAGSAGGPGGGGGGGGSLVPDHRPSGIAKRGERPAVRFSAPGTLAPGGQLVVTSTQTLKQDDQGDGIVPFTNCTDTCEWVTGSTAGPAPANRIFDMGYDSTEAWGTGGLQYDNDFRKAFLSVRPAAAGAPAELGEPFLLSHLAHYNWTIRFGSPSMFGIQTLLTVQPPAGPPAVFHLRGDNTIPLEFLETDNTPPCNPAIQESSTSCDDRWTIPEFTRTTTAGGVTWHVELLGWRRHNAPFGTFVRTVPTEETAVTQWDLYAQVTVDTNPTTSALAVEGATSPVLTMTTTPVPQTGGTVTFTDGGAPIAGCADVPVNATTGVTECIPADVSPGPHTFGGGFAGGIGYAASDAAPVEFTGRQAQTISFDAPVGVTYGDADVALGATSSSGLPVTFGSSTPQVCSTTGEGVLQVLGAGECAVTASQAGSATYAPAEQTRTFTIAKATLTVTADDQSRPYGEENPTLTATTTGFVNDDPASVVSGTPSLSTTATIDSAPGEYPIEVSVAALSATNYDFIGVDGTLTIGKSPTTTTLSATPDPSELNQAVVLTATVSPGGSGTVSFHLDGAATPLASAPVTDGKATALVLLPGGEHSVVAEYSGDDSHEASTSTPPTDATVGCDRTITGRYRLPLLVVSGTTCVLPGSRIEGPVIVARGASLSLDGASVRGAVVAAAPRALRVCGTTATGILVAQAAGFVLVGDPAHGCAANTVTGGVVALRNSGGLVITGNNVSGGVLALANGGAGPLPGQEAPVVGDNRR